MNLTIIDTAREAGRLITPRPEHATTHLGTPIGLWGDPTAAIEAAATHHTNPLTLIKPPLKGLILIPGVYTHHASGDVLGYYLLKPCGIAGCGTLPGEACETCGRIEPEA